jgi:hypothetical protein
VAQSADWVQRHPLKPSWPRVLPSVATTQPGPYLPVPEHFGLSDGGGLVGLDRPVQAEAGKTAGTGGVRLPDAPWPNVKFALPLEGDPMPAPDAQDFDYYSSKLSIARGSAEEPKPARQKVPGAPKVAAKPTPPKPIGVPNPNPGAAPVKPSKPVGHQLSVSKPTASLTDAITALLKPSQPSQPSVKP